MSKKERIKHIAQQYLAKHGRVPHVSEVMTQANITSIHTASIYISQLRREGLLPAMSSKVNNDKMMSYLRRFIDQNGYPPSLREIAKGMNISSTSIVWYHLRQLEESGAIERTQGRSRAIRLIAG